MSPGLEVAQQRTAQEAAAPSPTPWARALYAPSCVDWVMIGYLVTVLAGLGRAPAGLERDRHLGFIAVMLLGYVAAVYVYRLRYETDGNGGPAQPPRRRAIAELLYHLLPVPAMLVVFFRLRSMLPIINPGSYDEALFRLDAYLFGAEPTLLLERVSSRAVVEWFAAFYYSYFYLIACFVFVHIFSCRDRRRLAYFGAGFITVVSVGHFLYTLVPGVGPYAHLAHDYQAPLRGGAFFDLVLQAVGAGGAMRDIFPSLHTALPSFCTMFAWKHYRRLAPVVTFFAANILCATIVLRWHWAVDVLAGLTLATCAFVFTPRLVEGYQRRRERLGLGWMQRW